MLPFPASGPSWVSQACLRCCLQQEDGQDQMLPTASASRFPLWVVEKIEGGLKQVVGVPTASETGWVNPISYSELWVPLDSPALTMKLCLGMLVKDGVPRYVMPMVDIFVEKKGQIWRNRGLNSVPVSHAWESIDRAAAGSLAISAYMEERILGSEIDRMWATVAEELPVTDAFAEIVNVLADPPEDMHLESGFNLLVAEVAGLEPLPVPDAGGRVRIFLTNLPRPSDLLELPGLARVAELDFSVVSVASGGESEFLPDVYKELFTPG